MKDEPPQAAIAQEEVTALIDDVFRIFDKTLSALERVQTEDGEAAYFNVSCERMGVVACLYPLEPPARKLIQTAKRLVALFILAHNLSRLPLGLAIGMENAADAASVDMQEAFEVLLSVTPLRDKVIDGKANNERRAVALEKMNRRNTALVSPPKRGPAAMFTLPRIAAAANELRLSGQPVTVNDIAKELKCSTKSVYNVLEEYGLTLDGFLDIRSRVNN
jgi:hypothetical protein